MTEQNTTAGQAESEMTAGQAHGKLMEILGAMQVRVMAGQLATFEMMLEAFASALELQKVITKAEDEACECDSCGYCAGSDYESPLDAARVLMRHLRDLPLSQAERVLGAIRANSDNDLSLHLDGF